MSDRDLEKIFTEYIQTGYINISKLYAMGFTKHNIDVLFKKGILLYVNDTLAINSRVLLTYCKDNLLDKNNIDNRIKCYKAILKTDTFNKIALFQLFIEYVELKDYDNAYEYLDKLYSVTEEPYLNDCNYYLYLMSRIKRVPKKYQTLRNYVWDMDVTDTMYGESVPYSKSYVTAINKIRDLSFRDNYTYAFSQYNNLTKDSFLFGRDYISKILLYKVIDVKKEETKCINELIWKNEINEALGYLQEIERKHPLSNKDLSLKKLILYIYDMILNNKIPKIRTREYNGKNVFTAINAGDLEKAYYMNSEYIAKTNTKEDIHQYLLNVIRYMQEELQRDYTINYEDEWLEPIIKNAILYKLQLLDLDIDKIKIPSIKNYEELNNFINLAMNDEINYSRKLIRNEN